MSHTTSSIPIVPERPLPTPAELWQRFPVDDSRGTVITAARKAVAACLEGRDDRLLVVAGPCSMDDPEAALEYGLRLRELSSAFGESLLVVMRAYFEKPRTRLGWKGAIHDPRMDGSDRLDEGLSRARQLLWELSGLGLPLASELLDPLCTPFIADLLSWVAVGARTSESQVHRELASGLSSPVGFKNGTDGEFRAAIDAIMSARAAHTCLGIDALGRAVVRRTDGNGKAHLVLRGGRSGPNYQRCEEAHRLLAKEGAALKVVVDCSHDNSGKRPERQSVVAAELSELLVAGGSALGGVMFESHLVAGRQDLRPGTRRRFGQSVTDACMDLRETERCFELLARAVRARRRSMVGTWCESSL